MSEEHITRTVDQDGSTHTSTTVIRDTPHSGGGAGRWLVLLFVTILAIGAFLVFDRMGQAEAAKDVAVADAAESVGNAAQQVGNAVEQGVDNLSN